MTHQHITLEDTVYFWFASNNTSGSGDDGASAAADVRLAGASASAAPLLSPTPALLSHANYPAGAYEVAVPATAANGFASGNSYAVFATLAVDSQNPTGFIGSFTISPVPATLSSSVLSSIASTIAGFQMTEGYAADGVAPTVQQSLFMIMQGLLEFIISGTTITTRRLDGSTTAMSHTIDDATTPTSRTRSS